jgi:hypothetical protein
MKTRDIDPGYQKYVDMVGEIITGTKQYAKKRKDES